MRRSLFLKEAAENTTLFDWENFDDFNVKRQFSKLSIIGTAKLPEEKIERVCTSVLCKYENTCMLYVCSTEILK